jgi:hypothetical protein
VSPTARQLGGFAAVLGVLFGTGVAAGQVLDPDPPGDDQVGSALDLAVITAIATSQGADRLRDFIALTDGYQAVFIAAAAMAVAGAVLAAARLDIPKVAAAMARSDDAQESIAA